MNLERGALQALDGQPQVSQQEGPGVDEVDPVHGHHHDAVPALETPRQAVFDEERVGEHKAVLLVAKKYRAFPAWTHLPRE